jgi:hypothetical protein
LQDGISASSDSVRFCMEQQGEMEDKKKSVEKDY